MSKDKSKKWVISAPLFYNYAEFLGFKFGWLSAAGAAFMRLLPVAVIAALCLRTTY
ncbi:MAG: hypothetical protein PUB35_02395 [Campylobacteraceae bacterium]|nr:hypothetical protein [Campylobacteraceae bacterium]